MFWLFSKKSSLSTLCNSQRGKWLEYSFWNFLISKDWKDLDLLSILGLDHRNSRMSSPFLSWQLWIQLNLESDWLKATLRLRKIETIFWNIPSFHRFQVNFKFTWQTFKKLIKIQYLKNHFLHANSIHTFSFSISNRNVSIETNRIVFLP